MFYADDIFLSQSRVVSHIVTRPWWSNDSARAGIMRGWSGDFIS